MLALCQRSRLRCRITLDPSSRSWSQFSLTSRQLQTQTRKIQHGGKKDVQTPYAWLSKVVSCRTLSLMSAIRANGLLNWLTLLWSPSPLVKTSTMSLNLFSHKGTSLSYLNTSNWLSKAPFARQRRRHSASATFSRSSSDFLSSGSTDASYWMPRAMTTMMWRIARPRVPDLTSLWSFTSSRISLTFHNYVEMFLRSSLSDHGPGPRRFSSLLSTSWIFSNAASSGRLPRVLLEVPQILR